MTNSEVSDRIGFRESKLEQLPNNRCRARVVLARPEGDEFAGAAQGEDTERGRLKSTVEATARALEKSVNDEIALNVQGVQTITESHTNIIVALLEYRLLGGMRQQLVGSCIIGKQPAQSATFAVLKATNRLMGNVIVKPSDSEATDVIENEIR